MMPGTGRLNDAGFFPVCCTIPFSRPLSGFLLSGPKRKGLHFVGIPLDPDPGASGGFLRNSPQSNMVG